MATFTMSKRGPVAVDIMDDVVSVQMAGGYAHFTAEEARRLSIDLFRATCAMAGQTLDAARAEAHLKVHA